MKTLDVIVGVLLVIGGLNYGLVALFGVDVIAYLFGVMSVFTRLIYLLIGLSAVYEIFEIRSIQHRWAEREAAHGIA